ncbi:hypothetical protein KUTeg_021005, partial [Tegillarca granosa]
KKKKKKEKAESNENKTDEEIQQLVDHINGKKKLIIMPSTTKAGVDFGTTDDSKEKEIEEKKKKKRIFGKHSKKTDDFKYGIMSGAEDMKNHNVIGGFKVVKIEDERTLASEISITVETLKGDELDRKTKGKIKDESSSQNLFPLSAPLIRILFYVSNRKKRPCPGWAMDDDDVVACILPDDSTDQEGLTICIQKGFRFEERLTDEERKSLQKAINILRLFIMIEENKEEKPLYLNDGSTLHVKSSPSMVHVSNSLSDGSSPAGSHPDEGPLWEQMQRNPDKFELFVMVDKEKVADNKGEEKASETSKEEEDDENLETKVPESNLRRCAKCDTEEPHYKAFKKCQNC